MGGMRILVVEDNAMIRGMVVRQLAELGYRVLQAEHALDALARLESAAVDLLFTDMIMPGGVNGKQLASMARFKQPGLKVLFTSGFPGTAVAHDARLEADDILLRKPYRKPELARAVRDVLDAAGVGRADAAALSA